MATERDILWSQGMGKRLHAFLPHPLNREYMWSACGLMYGKKVLADIGWLVYNIDGKNRECPYAEIG